jgi:large subunit ribosomal protein L9
MSIEVILMRDVPGLGAESEVVRVAEGHARNYLYPQGLAAPVTTVARRRIEKARQVREAAEAATLAGAKALAAKIESLAINVSVKAGEDGKLFGSVTAANVLEAVRAQGVELEKHQVELPGPVKELGVVPIPVKLHPQVTATLKVWVVEE